MPYILFVLVVALSFWAVSICNTLTRMRNRIDEAYMSVKACSGEEKEEQKQRYNAIAKKYNKMIASFPASFVASLFGFEEKGIYR